jgi:hypothetical protein
VNAEASVRRSGCRSRCAVEHLGEFLAGALRLSREVALDGSTQGNPIIVRGKQESQTDDRPIEKLGLGEILKLLDLELFAKILAPAELLSACVAPSRDPRE